MARRRTLQGSAEDRMIARHFRPLAHHPGALGLIDDAALLKPRSGRELVITKDAIVAGVHFFADDPADTIARKALRVNLSDLAAKGAEPAGFLMALALPPRLGDAWLERFARGLGADARAYCCPLLGGDTVRTPGPLIVSITAFGTLPRGQMVKRSGAREGDLVLVTGTIGDAALGLRVRQGRSRDWRLSRGSAEHLVRRYRLPQPRNALAVALRRYANSGMDVSDGLAGDLAKLCRASGVAAEIAFEKVPLSAAARSALHADASLRDAILGGGDDYEIVCTMPARRVNAFLGAAEKAGVRIVAIGRIVRGRKPLLIVDGRGRPIRLKRASFSHF